MSTSERRGNDRIPRILVAILCASAGVASAQTPLEQLERQVAEDLAAAEPLPDPTVEPNAGPETESGYFGILGDNCPEGVLGVQVLEVIPGGPAARAGLAAGDRITDLAGQAVTSAEDFSRIALSFTAGDQVELVCWRSDQAQRIVLQLDRRPVHTDRSGPAGGPRQLPAHSQDGLDPAIAGNIQVQDLQKRIKALEQRVQRLERLVLELAKSPRHATESPP